MTVGNLVVNLTATTNQFTSKLSGASSTLNRFANSTKGYLLGIGTAIAATAASWLSYQTVVQSVAAYQTQALAERKLEQVLKSTGNAAGLSAKQIKDWASTRQGVTNFGDEATIAGAAILATFTQIRGPEFLGAMTAIQDMSAMMGTDMKSAAIQVGKALNAPILGVSALAKVGVSFTQQQKDQIRAMVEAGDVASAQQLILKELAVEFGGQAEAGAILFTQISNALGDSMEQVGKIVVDLADAFNTRIDIVALINDVTAWLASMQANLDVTTSIGVELAKAVESMAKLATLGVSINGNGEKTTTIFEKFNATLTAINKALDKVIATLGRIPGVDFGANFQTDAVGGFSEAVAPATGQGKLPRIFLNINDQRMENRGIDPEFVRAIQRGLPKTLDGKDGMAINAIRKDATTDRLAGAMEQGSTAAYSAIVQASQRQKDDQLPVLKQIAANTSIAAKIQPEIKIVKAF